MTYSSTHKIPGKEILPMKFSRQFLTVGFALCSIFAACSSDSSSAGISPIRDKTIGGFAEKGPFLEGTTVTLYELDGKTFEKTGNSFSGKVEGKRGAFSIPNVNLASPYALLEVSGTFLGETAVDYDSMTLYALTDLRNRENANVNLLTHLEYGRTLKLLREGKTFSEAKTQALNEILSAFGFSKTDWNAEDLTIFGSRDEDAELLFLSARFFVYSFTTISSMDSVVENFVRDMEDDGVWNDDSTKMNFVYMQFPTGMIRGGMESWQIADTIPNFEKYYRIFCESALGPEIGSRCLPN